MATRLKTPDLKDHELRLRTVFKWSQCGSSLSSAGEEPAGPHDDLMLHTVSEATASGLMKEELIKTFKVCKT